MDQFVTRPLGFLSGWFHRWAFSEVLFQPQIKYYNILSDYGLKELVWKSRACKRGVESMPKTKCNYSNVDVSEVLNYGAKAAVVSDVLKEAVFKKSGHHKGAGKSSISDQIRCFRLKNHFLYYYQGDSLPIVDKNVLGVIILINVYISRGLMNSPTAYGSDTHTWKNIPNWMFFTCQNVISYFLKRSRSFYFFHLQKVICELHSVSGDKRSPKSAAWYRYITLLARYSKLTRELEKKWKAWVENDGI